MQRHCKKAHNWSNSQTRGGNTKTKLTHTQNKLWVTNQHCQRFFEERSWQQYFQVMKDADTEPRESDAVTSMIQLGEDILDQQLKEVEEYKKRKTIEVDDNRYVANPWLKRTGWAKHLAGLNREELIALMEPPNATESDTEEATN
ncbi:hypothetical protein K3495_g15346, partial [Podosphaera aphanis]